MDTTERRRRASAEAADWWACLQAPEAPCAQRESFVEWLQESPLHVAEMLRMTQVHGALEQFQRWGAVTNEGGSAVVIALPVGERATPVAPIRQTRRRRWLAAAAVALLCVVTALLLPSLRGQVIVTDRGERREVVLDDGSVVQVDPQTRLRVQLDSGSRRVRLERGRALFRVARDPARPFTVRAHDTTVRAVGTAFGVDRQPWGVVVTVTEGRVAVARKDEQTRVVTAAPGVARPPVEVLLAANQQLTVQQMAAASHVRIVDSERELAWSRGWLIFDNQPVAGVVEQFNRYNRVQLRVVDPKLAARPVSAVFSATDPESFIDFLQDVAPVRVVRSEGGIVISSRRSE